VGVSKILLSQSVGIDENTTIQQFNNSYNEPKLQEPQFWEVCGR